MDSLLQVDDTNYVLRKNIKRLLWILEASKSQFFFTAKFKLVMLMQGCDLEPEYC